MALQILTENEALEVCSELGGTQAIGYFRIVQEGGYTDAIAPSTSTVRGTSSMITNFEQFATILGPIINQEDTFVKLELSSVDGWAISDGKAVEILSVIQTL